MYSMLEHHSIASDETFKNKRGGPWMNKINIKSFWILTRIGSKDHIFHIDSKKMYTNHRGPEP